MGGESTSRNEDEPGDTSTVWPFEGACTRPFTGARSSLHASRSASVAYMQQSIAQNCLLSTVHLFAIKKNRHLIELF